MKTDFLRNADSRQCTFTHGEGMHQLCANARRTLSQRWLTCVFALIFSVLGVVDAWAGEVNCSFYLSATAGAPTLNACTAEFYGDEGSKNTIPAGTLYQAGAESPTYYYKKIDNDKNYYEIKVVGGFKEGDAITVYLYASGGTQAYMVGKTAKTNVSESNASGSVYGVAHTLTAEEIESDGSLRIYRSSANTHFAGFSMSGTRETYLVTYDAQGGILNDNTQTFDGINPLTAPIPTKDGMSFDGWYNANTGGEKVVNGGGQFVPTANTILYARYKVSCTHTVSTSAIGATDYSSGWWTNFSESYELKANKMIEFNFVNHGNSQDNWHNWVLVASNSSMHNGDGGEGYYAANGGKEYFVLRADDYGWGDYYTTPTLYSSKLEAYLDGNSGQDKWNEWKEDMTDARVNMKVAFSGTQFFVYATITGKSGTVYTYIETSKPIPSATSSRLFFTVDQSYITGFTASAQLPAYAVFTETNPAVAPNAITITTGNGLDVLPGILVDARETLIFKQTPSDKYDFIGWSVSGADYTEGTDYTVSDGVLTLNALKQNTTVTANYTALPVPTITTQPSGVSVYTGEVFTLSVVADANARSYQWYSCDADGNNAVALGGKVSPSMSETISSDGTFYYKCVVSNGNGSVTSNVVAVTVTRDGVSISIVDGVATLTANQGSTIYYTLDGKAPTTASAQATTTITLPAFAETTTVKAFASDKQSKVTEATYVKYPMVWDIFDAPTTSLHTWNSIKTAKSVYNAIESKELEVNGTTIVHGVYFSAPEKTGSVDGVTASIKDYRILLGNRDSKFTLKDVPAGYYIKVTAMPNTGTVELTASGSAQRIDGQGASDDKHTYIYKVSEAGDYTITPSRACYIYDIAVVEKPTPALSFDKESVTYNAGDELLNVNAKTNAQASVILPVLTQTVDNVPSSAPVIYSSNDETVVTVDPSTGALTFHGAGIATITATVKAGDIYASDATASYDVYVTDNYSYVVAENYQPANWTKITFNNMNMYYGAWKYQSQTGTYNGGISDKWDKAHHYTVGNEVAKDYASVPLDGFRYFTSGNQNAKSEFLDGIEGAAGYDYDYKLDVRGGVKGNPFTVPSRGDFVKFEPDMNGLLTVYVLQNGTINYASDYDHLTNTISWRPLYIVDEAGERMPYADVKAVTKQAILISPDDETTDVYGGDKADSPLITDKTYAQMVSESSRYEKYFSKEFDGEKFWPSRGTTEKVWGPDVTGDGWVVISKAYVKYQFPVKAGKSYYVFLNSSKMGMCGFNFRGDGSSALPQVDLAQNNGDAGNVAGHAATFVPTYQANVSTVTCNHTFHEGWNSICLPFSMTESKMKEWFSSDGVKEDYDLVVYNGATDHSVGVTLDAHFFHHVYQDIVAGYPYMLYIPAGAKALAQTLTVDNVTIEDPATHPIVNISTSETFMPGPYKSAATKTDYTFVGTYNNAVMPAYSYLVSTEGLYRISQAYNTYGYRAYLAPTNPGASAKMIGSMDFYNILDDELSQGDATVINEIASELGLVGGAPANVYSIQGQLVRANATSLEGLPQGIYIVNGKKYFSK